MYLDSPIAPRFHMYKVKYVELRDLLVSQCIDLRQYAGIDFYINIEMVLRKLFMKPVLDYLTVSRESKHLELVSHFINLAGHYRRFFTGNKHHNRIFLYAPWELDVRYDNQQYMPSYRQNMKRKFSDSSDKAVLWNTLENVIPLTQMIMEYLDGIYFITSDTMEPSLIPYTIDASKSNPVKIILTDDPYDYQYLVHGFHILNVSKQGTWIANCLNGTSYLKRRMKTHSNTTISLNHVPFLLAISGDERRSIPNVPGHRFNKAIKALERGISSFLITPETDDINLLTLTLPEKYVNPAMTNFAVTSLEKQYERFESHYAWKVTSQMRDRFDNESLRRLADEYFIEYPIMVYEMNNYYPSSSQSNSLFR